MHIGPLYSRLWSEPQTLHLAVLLVNLWADVHKPADGLAQKVPCPGPGEGLRSRNQGTEATIVPGGITRQPLVKRLRALQCLPEIESPSCVQCNSHQVLLSSTMRGSVSSRDPQDRSNTLIQSIDESCKGLPNVGGEGGLRTQLIPTSHLDSPQGGKDEWASPASSVCLIHNYEAFK